MRSRRAIPLFVVLVGTLLLVAALAVPLRGVLATKGPDGLHTAPARAAGWGTPPARPNPRSSWYVTSSPNPGSSIDVFLGVAAVSPSDVWAVGGFATPSETAEPLAEHWDGTAWSNVPIPGTGNNFDQLNAAAAITTNDVWAAGDYFNGRDNQFETFFEHWNGVHWSIVPSPNAPNAVFTQLNGIAAVAANDVWAVGYVIIAGGSFDELIEHWDGKQWSITAGPALGMGSLALLYGIAAVSKNDIWAVGDGDIPGHASPFITQHWDGKQWSLVPNPPIVGSGSYNDLYGVAARNANDVWAVGRQNGGAWTLVEHWDGRKWSIVPSPNPGNASNVLHAVAVARDGTAYAVGQENTALGLIERWDGNTWSVQTLSQIAPYYYFFGVAALSKSNAWAVGWYEPSTSYLTLAERYQPLSSGGSPSPWRNG